VSSVDDVLDVSSWSWVHVKSAGGVFDELLSVSVALFVGFWSCGDEVVESHCNSAEVFL
jgi:hypothetical protein